MTRLGMDADAVEVSAKKMQVISAQITSVRHQADFAVELARHGWFGEVVEMFVSDWNGTHLPKLLSAQQALDDYVQKLQRNIQDQRVTSNEFGARATADSVAIRPCSVTESTPLAKTLGQYGHQDADGAMLRLALDTYQSPPRGFQDFQPMTDADLKELGISPASMNTLSGLNAVLYHRLSTDDYVLAFQGTHFTALGWRDGVEDLGQVGLPTAQMADAGTLSLLLASKLGDRISFTGHSLGGSQAAFAARLTGAPAVTFNASGLGVSSEILTGVSPQFGPIRNYSTSGDVLSAAEGSVFVPDAEGEQIVLPSVEQLPQSTNFFNRAVGTFEYGFSEHMGESLTEAYEKAYGSELKSNEASSGGGGGGGW